MLKLQEIEDAPNGSTLLSHAGIQLAHDEYGITQERVQRVDDSCRTHPQSLCEAGKTIDDADDGLASDKVFT
jgi:hypothetical protein